MSVASLELCKELYELSGWEEAAYGYFKLHGSISPYLLNASVASFRDKLQCPAYDLGYLLRKLPVGTYVRRNLTHPKKKSNWRGEYTAAYSTGFTANHREYGSTPEDAAAKLAIELLKSGVLTSEHLTSQQASPKESQKEEALDNLFNIVEQTGRVVPGKITIMPEELAKLRAYIDREYISKKRVREAIKKAERDSGGCFEDIAFAELRKALNLEGGS